MPHIINEASTALRTAISTLAINESMRTGIRWVASPSVGPQTYEDLVKSVKEAHETGYLPVWDIAANRSIYGQTGIIEFRFWHDMGHVEYNRSFTFEDEVKLQIEVQREQVSRALERQGLYIEVKDFALKLLWANTVGQLEFGRRFGGFPPDQAQFDTDYACGLWEDIREAAF